MTIKKWRLISQKDVSPSPWFPVFKQKVRLPDGRILEDYFVSKLGNVAMIVAITSQKEMIFVRQYKHGVQDIILELPAGRIKKGNTPETEAKIELEEETGIVAENMLPLGEVFLTPSKDSIITYGFLTTEFKEGNQHLDSTEDIEVVKIPLNRLDDMIKNGEIKSSDTMNFIYLTKLKYPEIFK